jgi:hypothetical protein
VVTLVVLADLDEHWRPSEDVFRVADFESRLRFPVQVEPGAPAVGVGSR